VARLIGWLLFLAFLGGTYLFARDYVRRHPQDVPWTRLELTDPIGMFTARKLARLGDDPGQCRGLLRRAGIADPAVPPRRDGPDCGYSDGIRLEAEDPDEIRFEPGPPVTSCPVAAAMHLWESRIVQPAAIRRFGSRVEAVHHAGSYSCRRLYGREGARFSEHATADALDITGFTLADGRRIGVLADWDGSGAEAAFLRDVRDGACRLFATVLSPEYNQAHADHLHFDQAERGENGFRLCS
jgi:hypothetical protein